MAVFPRWGIIMYNHIISRMQVVDGLVDIVRVLIS